MTSSNLMNITVIIFRWTLEYHYPIIINIRLHLKKTPFPDVFFSCSMSWWWLDDLCKWWWLHDLRKKRSASTATANIWIKGDEWYNLIHDIQTSTRYLFCWTGASALHLSIAYRNEELTELLISKGININQRATGNFFMPTDQQPHHKLLTGPTNFLGKSRSSSFRVVSCWESFISTFCALILWYDVWSDDLHLNQRQDYDEEDHVMWWWGFMNRTFPPFMHFSLLKKLKNF